MTPDDLAFLKQAFQAVADEPLEAGDPRYVDLTAVRGGEDPVALMARTIELSEGGSVQLFSGFPGTGKTTELKRLHKRLAAQGYATAVGDGSEFLARKTWSVESFLLWALRCTLGELAQPKTASFTLGVPRPPPSSSQKLASYLKALPAPSTSMPGTVLVVDSMNHVPSDDLEARQFVEDLFITSVDQLKVPRLHLVCTVPSYLTTGMARARRRLETIHMLPTVAVRSLDGATVHPALGLLVKLVGNRVELARLFGTERHVEHLVSSSGGNLRDLVRLVRETIRRADALPAGAATVDSAISQLRAGMLPLASEDVANLARVAAVHELVLEAPGVVDRIVRWAEAHLVQHYRNGRDWYDVHPLIRDTVLQQAREVARPSDVVAREPDAGPASAKLPRAVQPPERVALTPDMRVTLVVESYRALRRVRWTLPRGVSALVGPNGSGKTTLLDVPDLLRHALSHDMRKAIDDRGGPGTLRSVDADRNAPVVLGAELDELAWQLDLSPKGAAFNPLYGERATLAGAVVLDRASTELRTDDARPLLRRFADLEQGAALRPLVTLLEGYRLYGTYDIASIRVNGSQVSSDEHLHPDGRNIFSVLRNWRDRKETRPRWDFVIESLRAAFPDTFQDLDFDMAGQTVSGRIVAPKPDVRIPTYFAANGWLVALLHLAAVASTQPAGAVALDEVENGLHPFAIRALIEAMRSWADRTGISIVLATHSPVVLDQFKDAPDHLFVMEPGRDTVPVRLDELHDPEWLAHFSLGDLYAHDEFGAQHKDGQRVA